MQIVKLLVTGAGAPGIRGTLYALRRNPDGVKVEVVGTDINADVAGRYLVDRFYQIPPPESDEYIPTLTEICFKEGIRLILPQTTREVRVLAEARDRLSQQGIRVAVSRLDAINLANNKARLLDIFASYGLPHPRYRLVHSEEELIDAVEALGYPELPVVVRPPVSNGMRGLRILKEEAWDVSRYLNEKPDGVEISLGHLLQILRRGPSWPTLLVTEYLPGPEYTVDAFFGKNFFVAVPRLRRVVRSGITFLGEVEERKDLNEIVMKAAQLIGLEYAFGFQFKMDANGVVKVLECNPRIQGTMVASVLAGYNIPWFAVRELMGFPVSLDEMQRLTLLPVKFYRYWGGIGVADDLVLDEI